MSVNCPACKADNKSGAKFCLSCGLSFADTITCPSCNALNKPGKFCASCGHSCIAQLPKADEKPVPMAIVPKSLEVPHSGSDQRVTSPVAPEFVQPPAPVPRQEPKVSTVKTEPAVGKEVAVSTFSQVPAKTTVKLVYALIPVLIVALAGAYWWKSNHVEIASVPAVEAPKLVAPTIEVTPSPTVAPPVPAALPASAEQSPLPSPEPVPIPEVKSATVIVVPKPEINQLPSKSTATTAKPIVRDRGLTTEKPVASRTQQKAPDAAPALVIEQPQPQQKPQTPRPMAPVKTLDETYNQRISDTCPQGFLPGVACREKIRWELCDGKWSANPPAGQDTCKGAGR